MNINTRIAYLDVISDFPGPLAFAVNATGALIRLGFLDGDYPESLKTVLTRDGYVIERDESVTAPVRAQLLEYCAGTRRDFDLPMAPEGTEWQQQVWRALTSIPFGETRTYGAIADELGRPGAARAVGRANAGNPIALVVPCHRVIGANGSLTGFAGGTHIKERLLSHESRVAGAAAIE